MHIYEAHAFTLLTLSRYYSTFTLARYLDKIVGRHQLSIEGIGMTRWVALIQAVNEFIQLGNSRNFKVVLNRIIDEDTQCDSRFTGCVEQLLSSINGNEKGRAYITISHHLLFIGSSNRRYAGWDSLWLVINAYLNGTKAEDCIAEVNRINDSLAISPSSIWMECAERLIDSLERDEEQDIHDLLREYWQK